MDQQPTFSSEAPASLANRLSAAVRAVISRRLPGALAALLLLALAAAPAARAQIVRSKPRHMLEADRREKLQAAIQAERERIAREGEREEERRKSTLQKVREEREQKAREALERELARPAPPSASAENAMGKSGAPGVILKLLPAQASVRVGQRFATEVVVYSEKPQRFDALDVEITYPEEAVQPIAVFDFPLTHLLGEANPPETSLDGGVVSYRAELTEPMEALGNRVALYIAWEVVGRLEGATLSAGRRRGEPESGSAVQLGARNLLETNKLSGLACIDSTLVLHPPEGLNRPGLRVWRAGQTAEVEEVPSRNRIRYVLSPPKPHAPQPGDEFVLDVRLENPAKLAFDALNLAVAFDPSQVRVLDWDYKGRIRRGVNVFDAHAVERYPFDRHVANDVDNARGRIDYRMGLSRPAALPSGGLIRIHCLALGPRAATSFDLFPENQTREWYSDVTQEKRSLLLKPGGEAEGRVAAVGAP